MPRDEAPLCSVKTAAIAEAAGFSRSHRVQPKPLLSLLGRKSLHDLDKMAHRRVCYEKRS